MKAKLTVLITCKNERHNIAACIESARELADEILVADSGSTDDTLAIVERLGGCRIVQRDFYHSAGNFKNWAIPQAAHDWLLVIDADERVTPQLAAEVKDTMAAGHPNCDAYRIRFDNYFLGRRIKHCGWNTASSIRLFNRQVCRYREMRVHADVDVDTGRIGQFQGRFEHHTCSSLTEYMEKVNRYTEWSALEMHEKGRRVSRLAMFLRGPLRFLQMYFYRGGFLDGTVGLILCLITGHYTFMKYAKLWELQQREAATPALPQGGVVAPLETRAKQDRSAA